MWPGAEEEGRKKWEGEEPLDAGSVADLARRRTNQSLDHNHAPSTTGYGKQAGKQHRRNLGPQKVAAFFYARRLRQVREAGIVPKK
ncbi:hypothetical protein TcasGA2_TC007669 [Tribolium castaneum]|uniref:Uncharacterized protein n=1 Tax=Tribolium castaneum TaxID=7070 RepID=D2A2C7_TRICA|nr:hypothetical protein TcasGA2_TC007669 [Tribolium castaneum]